jgi:hypothetical protein
MLAMLPMMAALPVVADGCSALGWPVLLATGAPLAAMLLHQPVQGGLLGAVTLVVERGAVWRPPGLSAHGLHAGLARW